MKRLGLLFLTILLLSIGVGCMNRGYKGFTKNIEEFRNENNPKVVIELDNGKTMYLELFPEVAPITVENFLKLIDEDFFAGLIFHRVIPGFMIQGGGYTKDFKEKHCDSIKGEFKSNGVNNELKHTEGVLSMARSQDKNSAGSQFFIVTKDAPHLDGQYASFGKVIKGMDVVHKIENVQTDSSDKPTTPVVIESIKVDTKGVDYKEPVKMK